MKFFKLSLLILAFGILTQTTVYSQNKHYHHNVFWGRFILADTINSKIKWEVWLQQRTQNTQGDLNIFKAPQFATIWLWLNYNINKDLKVAVTPFSYFNTWTLYTKPSDIEAEPVKEYRWVARVEQQNRFRYFNFINRLAVEYRMRDLTNNNIYLPNYRFRYMARFEKTVQASWMAKPITFIVNDEVMLQAGKAVENYVGAFDQNRIYAGFNYGSIEKCKV